MQSEGTSNVLFYVVAGCMLAGCVLYNYCFKFHLEREMRRHQMELGHTYREDVIVSDGELANSWICDICLFKNYQVVKNCVLCGTVRGYKLFEKTSDEVRVSFAKRQLGLLSNRQQGARRRKDWIQKVENGEIEWIRNVNVVDRRIEGAGSDTVVLDIQKDEGRVDRYSEGFISELVNDDKKNDRMTFVMVKDKGVDVEYTHFDNVEEWKNLLALSFQEKQGWVVQHLAMYKVPYEFGVLRMAIRRDNILHMSAEQLLWATEEQMHQPIRVRFEDEPGVDAGGLEREWYTLLSEEIFSTETGLFLNCNNAYSINPASKSASEDHLRYFEVVGKFLGRALFEGILIDAHLTIPMYKHILGIPISLSDMQFVDMDVYRNLVWMQNNAHVDNLCLDFSMYVTQAFGPPKIVDLIPNGRNITVTDDNKAEYIHARLKWTMVTSISEQLAAFLKGFYKVIPRHLLSIFDHQELELIMCGIPDLNVQDWKAHTEYRGKRTKVKEWFWEILEQFTPEQRARLLQYTTGSARVPVQGFKSLTMNDGRICMFTLHVLPIEESMYPRAHTCFNRYDSIYLSIVIDAYIGWMYPITRRKNSYNKLYSW